METVSMMFVLTGSLSLDTESAVWYNNRNNRDIGETMSKTGLAAKPITKAQTRKKLSPSQPSGPLLSAGRFLMPVYLRLALSFEKTEIRIPEKIIEALRDFQQKKTRLIVAFRHPYGDEPQLLSYVFNYLLPRLAKKLKTPLPCSSPIRLVHDYAVPLWGGGFIRFILPRAGALPVYHVKAEPVSMKNIRAVLRDGNSPLGIAPEGQISYHSETLPRIEPGTVRIGFWCASELEKAARPEKVRILPISVHYQYDSRDRKKVLAALDHLESLCGMTPTSYNDILPRIEALENRILDVAEEYYTALGYRPQNPTAGESEKANKQRRWEALLPFVIEFAENILGLNAKDDSFIQRMYRVRLEGWDRIYPEKPIETLIPLETALAHRRTGEAWYAMRHMELFDLMSYYDLNYLKSDPNSFDRIVESVINLQDLAFRLMGGNITTRPNKIRKKAVIVPGDCLDLTERLPDYHKNPKQTARDVTDELANKFIKCIKVYHHEK